MNSKQLRRSILQLAISGRLVPQDPTDEPAIELLKRINPKFTLQPTNSPLPTGWTWCKLNDYVKLVTDFVASGSFASLRENVKYYREENYAVLVRTLDLQNNFRKDLVYTDKHGYEFLNNSNLFGGELVLPNVGSIGKVFRVPHLNRKMTLAPNSVMLRFHDERHIAWFYYMFSSTYGQGLLKSITSSIAQAKFNKTGFRNLVVPLPPLAEQERIVKEVERWFACIEQMERSREALGKAARQTKRTLLSLAISGRLVPQDPADEPAIELLKRINPKFTPITEKVPFTIPDSWVWCKVGDLGEIVTGSTPSKSVAEYYEGNIPFFKPADLDPGVNVCESEDHLSDLGYEQSRQLPPDSILVTCIGSIGKTGITSVKGTCNQQINAIIPHKGIFPMFVYFICHTGYMKSEMLDKASATTIAILNKGNFSKILIPLPPLAEQERIVQKVEELFAVLDALQ